MAKQSRPRRRHRQGSAILLHDLGVLALIVVLCAGVVLGIRAVRQPAQQPPAGTPLASVTPVATTAPTATSAPAATPSAASTAAASTAAPAASPPAAPTAPALAPSATAAATPVRAPPAATATRGAAAPGGAATPAWTEIYVVREGDTLQRIASRFGVSAEELARVNGLTNPNRLMVGQKLKVP